MYLAPMTGARSRLFRYCASSSFAACLTLAAFAAEATVTVGSMTTPRQWHRANVLNDGRVLISGGFLSQYMPAHASAEIYNPATGSFAPVAPMRQPRANHASVTLNDGRVLVAGGTSMGAYGQNPASTAEIYDPLTGQWSPAGTMNFARSAPIATLLADGRVLVMNRDDYSGPVYAEVYDPQTQVFTRTGPMVKPTSSHDVIALRDGRVLKIGGSDPSYTSHVEIWDPATNQWSATGALLAPRAMANSALLPDGRVLVMGGSNYTRSYMRTTEIYDPATGRFSAGAEMPLDSELGDVISTLPDGDIIVGAAARTLLRYQPATGRWNETGPRPHGQTSDSVALLPGSRLLFTGGWGSPTISDRAFAWEPACAPQRIAVAQATRSISGDGGSLAFTVTAAPGCRFETAALPAWVRADVANPLQMPASGSMTVSFTVQPNATGAERSATFYLGNNTITLNQTTSAACPTEPVLTPASVSIGPYASASRISVSAAATCTWRVSAVPGWFSVTSAASGTGNGSFSYFVPANTGAARSGSGELEFHGLRKTFTVSQAAEWACDAAPTVNPSVLLLAPGATSGTVAVTAPPNCSWSVQNLPSWFRVVGNTAGSGSGSFSYAVDGNAGATRSGIASVVGSKASSPLVVEQQGAPCAAWTISPSNLLLPASGIPGYFTVTAPAECSWTLSGLPDWVRLGASASGSGSADIPYTALANPGTARSASARLSGSGPALTLNLSQSGSITTTCSAPIVSGVPVDGYLMASTCAAGARGSSYNTARYTFTGAPGNKVTIQLSSTAFDTYVYLRSPSGAVIASDDDSGGGTNSRIPGATSSLTLPAGSSGTYTIEVTSFYARSTGAFRLSFTQQ